MTMIKESNLSIRALLILSLLVSIGVAYAERRHPGLSNQIEACQDVSSYGCGLQRGLLR